MLTIHSAEASTQNFLYLGKQYTWVIPDQINPKHARPLIVLLHGCKQNAKLILQGTQLQKWANQKQFYVLAPEQPDWANPDHCWNWFLPINQIRQKHESNSISEMKQIIDVIQWLQKQHLIDSKNISAVGFSAGAILAHTLFSCYPEYFSSAVIHSGVTYASANDPVEASSILTDPSTLRSKQLARKILYCSGRTDHPFLSHKLLVIQGSQDTRVHPDHLNLLKNSKLDSMDLLDNGKIDASILITQTQLIKNHPNGYRSTSTQYKTNDFAINTFFIEGLAHAWSGGAVVSSNFDPRGPSSTAITLDFLGL